MVSLTADAFIETDHHKVPFWHRETSTLRYRPLRVGDRASLWTYLDWMYCEKTQRWNTRHWRHGYIALFRLIIRTGDQIVQRDNDITPQERADTKNLASSAT